MEKLVIAMVRIPISRILIIMGKEPIPIDLKKKVIIEAMITFEVASKEEQALHAYETIKFEGGFFSKEAPELASIIKEP